MKAITDNAGKVLQAALNEANAPQDKCVRFIKQPQGANLVIDEPRPGDEEFAYEGRTVLVVGPDAAQATADRTLDHRDGEFRFS
jgi:hypothetical protein